MRVTGLFFVPTSSPDSSPAQDLIYRLNSAFEATQIGQWGLSYHLFRETPPSAQASSYLDGTEKHKVAGRQRVLQILALSHHVPTTYIAIAALQALPQTRVETPISSQQNGEVARSREPTTTISIPNGSPTQDFAKLIATKFGPLWQARQLLHVSSGATYEIGDFRIRIGDLKPGSLHGTGAQKSRGAICEVEWIATESETMEYATGSHEKHWRKGEPMIKAFWDSLEVKGAREVFWVPDLGDGLSNDVRQWFEILTQRSS